MNNTHLQEQFLTLLNELLQIASPSGREENMAGFIRRSLDEMGYEHETDSAGNVLVRLDGQDSNAPLCVYAAHMDEIGVVVTQINEDGTLRLEASGRLSPFKIGEGPLHFVGDKGDITAILSFGTGHTSSLEGGIAWKDVRAITGFSKTQLEELGIRPGSTGVPVAEGRGPLLIGDPSDPFVSAWTLDDRAGMTVQLQLLRLIKEQNLQPHHPTIIAFTVHEEGGCHGAKVLAHREQPGIFISVDGFPWVPDAGVEVNDRPACASMDLLAHYDQRLIKKMTEATQLAGTRLQPMVLQNAYCDASAVYNSGGAPRAGFIGHVRYNSHGFEVAKLSVFPNVANTLAELLKMEIPESQS